MFASETILAETTDDKFDIAVIGGGLVGLSAALAMAGLDENHHLKVAFIAECDKPADSRTTALLMPSVNMLEAFGIWADCFPYAAPLRTMRLIDGTRRLVRAPLTDFKATELGLEAFGYNVANERLLEVMWQAIGRSDRVTCFNNTVSSIDCKDDQVTIELGQPQYISTKLVVAADGRNSVSRAAAAIDVKNWSYPQTAIVLNFRHALSHNGVSTEFHRESGPFTTVPLPAMEGAENRSGLVWTENTNVAADLLHLDKESLATKIETILQSSLGKIIVESTPQSFPFSGQIADRFGSNRVALLGEAAHLFPPIGAQGFNLGLRDVTSLRSVLEKGLWGNPDAGAPSMLAAYDTNRRADVRLSTQAVDMLNRSLLADFLPVQIVRAFGMATIGQVGWLKRRIMQSGLGGIETDYRDGKRSGGSQPVAMV